MTSPFPSLEALVETNNPPSPSQITKIKQLLEDSRPELLQLNADIEAAALTLDALTKKRDAHLALQAKREAILAPMRRLPLDIIHNIFLHCLPNGHNAVMSPSQAPMLLTQVCQRWRNIALSAPTLWSSLHLPLPSPPAHRIPGFPFARPSETTLIAEQKEMYDSAFEAWSNNIERRKQLLSLWLSRAKGAGLSLSIIQWDPHRWHFPPDTKVADPVESVLSLVRGISSQWERIEISASKPIVHSFLTLPVSQTPQLRYLDFSSPYDYVSHGMHGLAGSDIESPPPPNAPTPFPPESMITSPSLSSLFIKSLYTRDVLDMPVHWENLTDLYIGGSSVVEQIMENPTHFESTKALELLGRCPNLRRCGIVVVSFRRSPPDSLSQLATASTEPPTRVSLPHLERFVLMETSPDPVADFVQALELPSMRSLCFNTFSAPRHGHTSSLLTLMRNWGENLTSLSFDYRTLTPPELHECLQLARNVEELALSLHRERGVGTLDSVGSTPFDYESDDPDGNGTGLNNRHAPALFTSQLLAEMTPQGNAEDVLCPRITSLRIRLSRPGFKEEALLDFIRTRRNRQSLDSGVVSRIMKIKVNFCLPKPQHPHSNDNDWTVLATLRDDPDVDLDDLTTDIEWLDVNPYEVDGGFYMPRRPRPAPQSIWSPSYGLMDEGDMKL